MTQPRRQRERRVNWFIGLLLGIVLAVALAVGGTIGLMLVLAAIVGAWLISRSLAFESGLLIGIGGTWIGLLARVSLECEVEAGCFVPDQTPWVIAWLGLVGVGIVLGSFGVLRARRARRTALGRGSRA